MTDETTTDEQQTDETTEPQQPGQHEDPTPKPAPPPQKNESLEEANARLTRELADVRREVSRSRVNAKTKAADERESEIVRAILGALGRDESGERQVSVEELTQQLQASQRETKDLRVREAVRTVAADVEGADASRLLESVSFRSAIAELEPDDADGILAAVNATLEASPWLKVSQDDTAGVKSAQPKRSGTDVSGGSREGAITLEKFRAMSGPEKNALFQRDPNLYRELSDADDS